MRFFQILSRTYFKIFPYVKPKRGAVWIQKMLAKLAVRNIKQYSYPRKTIMDFKWDNLIILDGCRYDLFKEVVKENENFKIFRKNLSYIISTGSYTSEWIKNTFISDYPNIVYISANPFISKTKLKELLGKIPFFHIEPVWKYGWNNELETVLPENVTNATKKIYRKYKRKKFIVHYLQPHHPFVGKIRLKRKKLRKFFFKGIRKLTIWDFFEMGHYTKDEMWKAYKSNLEYVLSEVKRLLRYLKGEIVITSDHGNCFGEYGIYEHIPGIRIEELVKVPYIQIRC